MKHPGLIANWHAASNNVVIVSVPDEAALLKLQSAALAAGLKHQLVTEPDLDDIPTAIALEPGPIARRMCANYPLALRPPKIDAQEPVRKPSIWKRIQSCASGFRAASITGCRMI